jgi:hypothetical protein
MNNMELELAVDPVDWRRANRASHSASDQSTAPDQLERRMRLSA